MRRVIGLCVVVAVMVVAAATPVLAADHPGHGNSFHAYIDGAETGFSGGPNPGRCPAGTQWMLFTGGVGEAAGLGTFDYTTAHCSRVVTDTPAGAIGKLAAGLLVLTFDDTGDELHIAYQGTWKFDGDLTTGDGIAKIHQSWEVIGDVSTGMFAGAQGHGHMEGTDDFHLVFMELDGNLRLAD